MSLIAIIGCGPLAGALAHKLALRGRSTEVRLIDPDASIARGKALDIVQSGPIDGFPTRVTGAGELLAAAGADVVVWADRADGTEHADDAALLLIRQLESAGITPPMVFAGAAQRELMTRALRELRIPASRILGSAPMALSSALRALVALSIDTSPLDVALSVFGVPPRHAVVAWEEATIAGQPLAAAVPASAIAAMSARITSLWPPGPYALAASGAPVVEALCHGSRRQYSCFVDARRGRVAALPVELGRGGVRRVLEPALTTAERTTLENALNV